MSIGDWSEEQLERWMQDRLDVELGQVRRMVGWESWVDYSPTWTTLNGSANTVVCRYRKRGREVAMNGKLTFGAGGSFTGADVTMSLPFAVNTSAPDTVGVAVGIDTGVYRHFGYCVANAGASVANFRLLSNGTDNSLASVGATTPLTWGSGDLLFWHLLYEAAT